MDDPFDLARFVAAQEEVFAGALSELRAGRKQGHWMWFIFPQLRGLGSSAASLFYGIASLDEAVAYARRPLLGERLRECTLVMSAHDDLSAAQILGPLDAAKFRSSMTLFAFAAGGEPMFEQALNRFFDGERDPLTLAMLSQS